MARKSSKLAKPAKHRPQFKTVRVKLAALPTLQPVDGYRLIELMHTKTSAEVVFERIDVTRVEALESGQLVDMSMLAAEWRGLDILLLVSGAAAYEYEGKLPMLVEVVALAMPTVCNTGSTDATVPDMPTLRIVGVREGDDLVVTVTLADA